METNSAFKTVVAATNEPAVESYRPGGGERLFSKHRDGHYELNASSKQDAMTRIAQTQMAIARGELRKTAFGNATREEKFAAMRDAYSDQHENKFQVLGEAVGDTVWETLGREAFSRKLLMVQQVARGVDGKVKMRRKDVTAWMVTEDMAIAPAQVRQGYVYPPEFMLLASVVISNKDISVN